MKTAKWICLLINRKLVRKKDTFVHIKEILTSFLKDDLVSVYMPQELYDDYNLTLSADNYVLVKCKKYESHIEDFKNCSVVVNVLSDVNNPVFLSDSEVENFKKGFKSTSVKFLKGSVVKIKEGYLSGLYGIVVGSNADKCKVFFKLFSIQFIEELPKSNLTKTEKNVDVSLLTMDKR